MDIQRNLESLKLNGVKAIIFDFDNTISSTNKSLFQVLSKLFDLEFNLDLNELQVMEVLRMNSNLVDMFESILNLDCLKSLPLSALDLFELFKSKYSDYDYYTEYEFKNWFKELKIAGIQIAVVSNRSFGLKQRLQQLGFDLSGFISVVSQEDGFKKKPEPAMFMYVYDKLSKDGIKPNQIISIGDHLTDYKVSTYMGFHFFAYSKYTSLKKEFKEAGLDSILIFENWNNFNKVLEQKFKQL
ncbi:HAD family hydrolase [bacterium]|jgi:HAD superfamily hydrolase (TIGR01662 family)|nr:HAD family hydrolase [bacterium]MBT6293745.1 HAD family hydrolase [bacterium]